MASWQICVQLGFNMIVLRSLDVPQFLLSTKFFACLELDDSRKVAEATTTITLAPHSILFRAGDDGSSGIFVVVEGCLGMFLPDGEGLAETNKLMPGESVGDLDVIDGMRSVSKSSRMLALTVHTPD